MLRKNYGFIVNDMRGFFSKVCEWFKQNSVYVSLAFFLILGLLSIVFGMHFDPKCVWEMLSLKVYPRTLLVGIGQFSLIGVAMGFLTNTSTFEGIVQKSLEKVLYAETFLGCRSDIREMWRKVSKQVYDNKFPDIAQEFLDRVESFFPKEKDDITYYNDYRRSIHIEWEDENQDYIRVNEHISFELMTDGSKKEITYELWNSVSATQHYEQNAKIKVDGKERNIDMEQKVCGAETESTAMIRLEGSTKYKIEVQTTRKYKLSEDHFIGFKAKYILKGLFVTVDGLPNNLHVQFINRGIKEKFYDDVSTDSRRIVKRYQGIVLPQEGYVISIYKLR